jgi:hypothetical protein
MLTGDLQRSLSPGLDEPKRTSAQRVGMSADSNLFIVNIVELQNVVTNIQGVTPIQQLQADVANLQQMVLFDSKTIAADNLSNFTAGGAINVLAPLNLSNVDLQVDGVAVSLAAASNTVADLSTITGLATVVTQLQTGLSTLTFSTIFSGNTSITTNGATSTIQATTAGQSVFQISSSGMVQIVSTPQYVSTGLSVDGFLYVSETAWARNFLQTSDRSAKENLVPFRTCLDDVLKLEPYRFQWRHGGEADLGFIAQDVQAVWPELTTKDAAGQLGIATSRFIPLLLEGLRELQGRVSTLEGLMRLST